MNPVAIIDLSTGLVFLLSAVLILKNWKSLFKRAEKVLIVFLIILGGLFVSVGNFLEWAAITRSLDPLEDLMQILIVALWGFVFISILYERARKAAWVSESRFQNLLAHTVDAVFLHDVDGQILDVNSQAYESLGYTREELLELRVRDIDVSEAASGEGLQSFWEGVRNGKQKTLHGLHRRKDGSTFPVEVGVGYIPSADNELFVAIARDVTEREIAEKALRDSEEKFRLLSDNNLVGVYMIEGGTFTYVNRKFCEIFGYSEKELVGRMSSLDLVHPGDRQLVERNIQRRISREADSSHYQVQCLRKDGSNIVVEIFGSTVGDETEVAIQGAVVDITTHVEKDRKLAESEERYRFLADNVSDVIWILDLDFNYRYISPSVERFRGYTVDEAMAQTVREAMTPDSFEMVRMALADELAQEGIEGVDPRRSRTLELEYLHKNGHMVWGEVTASLMRNENGEIEGILGTTRDIEERKHAEKALLESEKRFRTAFRTSPDAITINRMSDGLYIDVNDGFTALTGYTKGEVVGVSSLEIDIWADPADREKLVEGLRNKGMFNNLEADFRGKDGTILTGLMSARIIEVDGEPLILTYTRVITDLKQAEAKIKSSLEEKEILLKEIHHRVKNNLQVISGLLNLQAHHITDERGREIYKESQNRVISMALIHEELYQARDLARVDFSAYMRNLAENLFASYGIKGGKVKLVLDADEIDMVVDTAIPCGLIINELISNSLKHAFPGDRGGVIRVKFSEVEEGEYTLSVKDDGIGLPEKVDIKKTSSLGMQLVTVLTEQLGGDLDIRSDEGTEFSIRFREYLEAGTALY